MDIAQLSYTLGFSDQSHFHRVFKNLTGTTPKLFKSNFYKVLTLFKKSEIFINWVGILKREKVVRRRKVWGSREVFI